MDDDHVSFVDLVDASHAPLDWAEIDDIQIIADLPALQDDLRSLFFRLTDEMDARSDL